VEKAIEDLGKEKILGVVFNGHDKAVREYSKHYDRYYKGNNKR
jgi:hypothetical protein